MKCRFDCVNSSKCFACKKGLIQCIRTGKWTRSWWGTTQVRSCRRGDEE